MNSQILSNQSTKQDQTPNKESDAQIGRGEAGVLGQNWTESPETAKKGRYSKSTDENAPESESDKAIDRDVSQAA